ncbi:hypothetical protein LTS15_004729 [Exophiala xenobiotica]|nr:hypothetical protein LTS15_004729 [Exophiala xenobiotica]
MIGPVVRISPYEFSTDSPSAIKPIYGLGTNFRKSFWYDASSNPDYHTEDIFSGRDPKLHAQNRRKVASLYSMTTLLKMEEPVNQCIDLLTQRLDEKAKDGKPIRLQWWMQCYAFDVISIITVDKRFGYLDEGKDPIGLIAAVEGGLSYTSIVGIYSEIHRVLFNILKRFGDLGTAATVGFATQQVQQRMSMLKKNPGDGAGNDNFLDTMLRMHAKSPEKFKFEDVIGTCSGNFFAGSDTTSITLTGLLWNLIDNPDVFKKLRDEIDAKAEGPREGITGF